MKIEKFLITMCSVFLFVIFSFNTVFANTVFPFKKEVMISNQEKTRETVSFRNDGKKDVIISPQVYSYNPQTLELSNTQSYIFVRTDKENFTVKSGDTLSLNYEIIPPSNISPGTYFNLILFFNESEKGFLKETNPVGMSDNLSHLIVLHITDSESSVYGITNEFALISFEIIEKGIPFIRPTRIKYIYQNITNYVLTPLGEIQIYNKEGAYSPICLKINEEQERLYPGGILEEEFEVEKWDITDLFNERIIVGRFYNGIDENLILKEINQEPNYILLALVGIFIASSVVLIKSVIRDKNRSRKKSV